MPTESYSHLPGGPDQPAALRSGAGTGSTRLNGDGQWWRCLLLGALSWVVLFTLYRWLA